jgi:hypothetical protein
MPVSAFSVAVDCARAPTATERTGDAFSVQCLHNGFWRNASHEVSEDSLDNRGLFRIDLPFARRHGSAVESLHDPVAVAKPARRLAVLDATPQSAVCLLGQILQEQGVHRALETDVEVGDVAFGDGHDVHAGKGEALEQSGGVFLVATEAVQRLGEHDIESAVQRIAHQRLKARAQKGGA